jgi:hypothetical protein
MLIRREAEIAHSQLVFARHVEPELAYCCSTRKLWTTEPGVTAIMTLT